MILMQGQGVSGGVAKGPVFFYRRYDGAVGCRRVEDMEAEHERVEGARRIAVRQLEALAEKCRAETGDEAAALFETHALLAEDEDYRQEIQKILEEKHCNAEYAVQQAGERFAALFSAMEDGYMRARAADIRDVSRRIIQILAGVEEMGLNAGEPVILAADDLAPSETIQLDRNRIMAFITRGGSANSHTAILARALGIPAICSLGEGLKREYEGRMAYVDGESGEVVLDPDGEKLAALEEKQRKQQEMRRLMESMKGREDISPDGCRIDICCNIASPGEADAVLANDGRGVGLFRSEFIFLAAQDYPGEEEQFRAYRSVVAAMEGKRVVIRTLDIGADKQAAYFGLKKEENPALGLRGVRLCLNRTDVFRTQLRAILRASAYGRAAILFPMISALWEVRECRRICRGVMAELEGEGIAYDPNIEIGVMIETPASVFIAGELAREVDFFSVGTNDLSQYILACDRQANDLDRFFDPHHPAVLRALKMVADAAHRAGIWVGVCGELGADPDLLDTFLALGIDELSVSPASVLPLRARLCSSAHKDCSLEKLKC